MCFYISTDHFYRGPTAFLNDNNCRFSYKNIQKHSESKFNKGTVISTHHGHHFNGNFGLLITSLNCSFLQGGMIAADIFNGHTTNPHRVKSIPTPPYLFGQLSHSKLLFDHTVLHINKYNSFSLLWY